MKLYTFYFPVNLDHIEVKNVNLKFTPPYTITKVLHQEMSHYVGYTVKDNTGIEVDVLNIIELRDYIKKHKTEFTNVIINEFGHMEIDNYDNLPLEESIEYSKYNANEGIVSMLNLPKSAICPTKIYKYQRNSENSAIKCSFSGKYKNHLKYLLKNNQEIVIPKPLYMYNGECVTDFSELFENIDISSDDTDLSLLDLKNAFYVDDLFNEANLKKLNLKMLNLPSKIISADRMFAKLECNILNLGDCDWSFLNKWTHLFYSSKIGKITAKNFKCHENLNLDHIFAFAHINEVDLELFANFKGIFTNSLFAYLTCKKLLNTQYFNFDNNYEMNKNCNFGVFYNLTISVFDTTQFNFSNITNFNMIFSNMKCNKFIFDPNLFNNVTTATKMFQYAYVKESLNLSSVHMPNLIKFGAIDMFNQFITEGTLTPPSSYGSATCFNGFFSNCLVKKFDIQNCDFSKAVGMYNFFNNATSIEGISFTTNSSLMPTKLEGCNNIFNNIKTPFINISNFNIMPENQFFDLLNYDCDNGIVTCKKGNKVLKCNVNYIITDKDNYFYKYLSTAKDWTHYYDVKDENNQMYFVRSTDFIKDTDSSYYKNILKEELKDRINKYTKEIRIESPSPYPAALKKQNLYSIF